MIWVQSLPEQNCEVPSKGKQAKEYLISFTKNIRTKMPLLLLAGYIINSVTYRRAGCLSFSLHMKSLEAHHITHIQYNRLQQGCRW